MMNMDLNISTSSNLDIDRILRLVSRAVSMFRVELSRSTHSVRGSFLESLIYEKIDARCRYNGVHRECSLHKH